MRKGGSFELDHYTIINVVSPNKVERYSVDLIRLTGYLVRDVGAII